MAEYAFADIITGKDILTDQVKDADIIGVKGYFTDNIQVIVDAFDSKSFPDPLLEGILETVSYAGRFKRKADGKYYSYFIREKEPVKKYVPFDLSKEGDRNFLKGRWIKTDGDEEKITGFERDDDGVWHIKISADYLLSEDMLNLWKFDDGLPCGKLIKED